MCSEYEGRDLHTLLKKAKELLETGVSDSQIMRELVNSDPEYIRQKNLVPGYLHGPALYFDNDISHPLFTASVHWQKQFWDSMTVIAIMSESDYDKFDVIKRYFDNITEIRCLICTAKGKDACICKRCKLCDAKDCRMNCYIDDGRVYWCDYQD